ncbi:Hypothetical protein RMP42_05966 [Roseomonas mucosa]|nr:Hypothetical protein RMP42_05966 [Roseomonas mucosa]
MPAPIDLTGRQQGQIIVLGRERAGNPVSRAVEAAQHVPRGSEADGRMGTVLPLTADERAALEAHAANHGVPVARLIRGALREAGLLSPL